MLYYNYKRKTTAKNFWQSQNKKGNTLNETSKIFLKRRI